MKQNRNNLGEIIQKLISDAET